MRYEIRVQGHLSTRLLRCFEGLTVRHEPNGDTLLIGPLRDQAAVHGLLSWLQDLGVALISFRQLDEQSTAEGNSES